MPSKPRTLVFHPGGPKTGSSAIQNFCEANRELLAAEGWAYCGGPTLRDPYQVYAGNGGALYTMLGEPEDVEDAGALSYFRRYNPQVRRASRVELTACLESFFADTPRALCSSELLCRWTADEWLELKEVAQQANVKLRVVMLVRDAVSYFCSMYDQKLKGAAFDGSLLDFACRAPWMHLDCLRALDAVFAPEQLTVLSYDACRQDLIAHLLQALEPDRSWSLPTETWCRVNRSLSAAERDILQRYVRYLGWGHAELFEDVFNQREPELQVPHLDAAPLVPVLTERFTGDIAWINQRFFGGIETVGLGWPGAAPKESPQRASSPEPPLDLAAYQETLEWAFARLARHESDLETLAALASASSPTWCPEGVEVPADFDAAAYLMTHRDVLASGMNPWLHYHLHGRAEGRSYRRV